MELKLLAAGMVFALAAGQVRAQAFEGEVELSFGRAPFLSTDDDDERLSDPSYKVSGWAGTAFGDWRVFGDVNVYNRDIGAEDFSSYAPEGARSYGLHVGRNFGSAYAGAFMGRNEFQSDDTADSNSYVSGKIYGVEGQYEMGAVTVFAQLGRAEMVIDPTDTAFVGGFQRLGVSATVDKLTMTADLEQGHSPHIFEDSGDSNWGKYRALGVNLDYRLSERLIATASYEMMDITANSEDSGSDQFYGVGIRIPLGASTGKRNHLTTSYSPGLAASWAANLD